MIDVLRPTGLEAALEAKAEHPSAVPIAGGTDLMVALNARRITPDAILDLGRVPELQQCRTDDGTIFLGASVTYTRILQELADQIVLAQAARTVGSLQIRNRGTVGGNLGTASPAGDALPALAAYDAEVVLASTTATRTLTVTEFLTGPKRNALQPTELIVGVRWRRRRHVGSFSKVGRRAAIVIAAASLTLVLDDERHDVRVALGAVGPTVLRAPDAERFAAEALAEAGVWEDPGATVPATVFDEFAARVTATARPIDDQRATAAYRRHVCGVLAGRALRWALTERTPTATAR
jgi:CO/xanthine dehydrogenase FAD-binding subunit